MQLKHIVDEPILKYVLGQPMLKHIVGESSNTVRATAHPIQLHPVLKTLVPIHIDPTLATPVPLPNEEGTTSRGHPKGRTHSVDHEPGVTPDIWGVMQKLLQKWPEIQFSFGKLTLQKGVGVYRVGLTNRDMAGFTRSLPVENPHEHASGVNLEPRCFCKSAFVWYFYSFGAI